MSKYNRIMNLLNIDKEYLNRLGMCDENIYEEHNCEMQFNIDKFEPKFELKENKKKPNIPDELEPVILVDEDDDYIETHKNLPKIPFSVLMSGARGSGKSFMATQLLIHLHYYFDKVILFSPTAELDGKWEKCFEKLELDWKVYDNIFYNYDEMVLKKMLDSIKKKNKNKKFTDKIKTLFIFDDIITQLPKNKKNTIFNRLLLNNRHYAASVIVISQAYKLLDSNFRKNCSQVFLWKTENEGELENYLNELAGNLGKTRKERRQNFNDLYEYATSVPHGCLYINYHQKDNNERYHQGLNNILEFTD